jgi:hypothetical protein
VQSALDAIQIHGAYGYSNEYPVERYLRNSKAAVIYEGTSQLHTLIQADYLLATGDARCAARSCPRSPMPAARLSAGARLPRALTRACRDLPPTASRRPAALPGWVARDPDVVPAGRTAADVGGHRGAVVPGNDRRTSGLAAASRPPADVAAVQALLDRLDGTGRGRSAATVSWARPRMKQTALLVALAARTTPMPAPGRAAAAADAWAGSTPATRRLARSVIRHDAAGARRSRSATAVPPGPAPGARGRRGRVAAGGRWVVAQRLPRPVARCSGEADRWVPEAVPRRGRGPDAAPDRGTTRRRTARSRAAAATPGGGTTWLDRLCHAAVRDPRGVGAASWPGAWTAGHRHGPGRLRRARVPAGRPPPATGSCSAARPLGWEAVPRRERGRVQAYACGFVRRHEAGGCVSTWAARRRWERGCWRSAVSR